jgi:uncharacterized protein
MKASKKSPVADPLTIVEVRRSAVHGQGVFALRELRDGQQIGHYAGRRYAADETHDAWDGSLTYLFGLSDGSVIDGAQGGNATRHINHACAPNVEAIERRGADGKLQVVVRAIRRVRAGEELLLDYALVIEGDDPAGYPCACGIRRFTAHLEWQPMRLPFLPGSDPLTPD